MMRVSSHGEANTLPGTIDQSASATDTGIIVETHRADFSGTAVDVELSARAVDGVLTTAGISPIDAEMEGVAAVSARVRNDGTTVLRFPADGWPEDRSTAQLSIHAVTVLAEARGFERLAGDWELTIELPDGDRAKAARAVRALEPVAVEFAGREIADETLLTHSAIVIRYELPDTLIVTVPPTLRVGDLVLEPTLSEQRGNVSEHWYEASSQTDSLTLLFDGVAAIEPNRSPWTLKLTLDADPILSGTSDSDEVQQQELRWRLDPGSDGPEVRGVVWRRIANNVRLEISLDGSSWRPGPSPPVVVGDGAEMEAWGAGFAVTSDGQPLSNISVGLDGSIPPRELVVTLAERAVDVPHTEVVLTP
jgi:hypothetical protein